MKRRIATVLIFLLLGAIVNIAVASWCAAILRVPVVGQRFDDTTVGWPLRCAKLNLRASLRNWLDDLSDDLPAEPLWLGLAINTLFYAAIIWGLSAALLASRRSRRIERGLCPACAYHVGTSHLCSECGQPVKPLVRCAYVISKRGIVMLLVFLALGAIVNIAVAWGCAAWLRDTNHVEQRGGVSASCTYRLRDGDLVRWDITFVESPALSWTSCSWTDVSHWQHSIRDTERTPESLLPAWAAEFDDTHNFESAIGVRVFASSIVGRGWPFVSMTCGFEDVAIPPYYKASNAVDLGWPSKLGAESGWLPRLLPLRVHFSGFAINTLFYAAILWLLFALPFALRYRRRMKRGLCPACAYPVGTSNLCTECGKPLEVQRRGMSDEQ